MNNNYIRNVDNSGFVVSGGDLNVSGNLTVSQNTTVNGTVAANSLSAQNATISQNATVNGTLTTNTLSAQNATISQNATVGGALIAQNVFKYADVTIDQNTFKAQILSGIQILPPLSDATYTIHRIIIQRKPAHGEYVFAQTANSPQSSLIFYLQNFVGLIEFVSYVGDSVSLDVFQGESSDLINFSAIKASVANTSKVYTFDAPSNTFYYCFPNNGALVMKVVNADSISGDGGSVNVIVWYSMD